ncbi:MAG: hypothetical protein K2G88_08975 [Oscillospiraceae bacterium]|nr:hypothetical protein [Oscillospiraceae bacterium]
MKNIRVASKKEIIIDKDLFSMLAYDMYLYAELSIMNATSRERALATLQRYTNVENYIKSECQKNRLSYKHYVTEQGQAFCDLIDKKFPKKFNDNEQEDDEIITDGQVPF